MPPFEWIFHAAAFLASCRSDRGYPTQRFFATEPYDGDQLPPRFRRALRNEPEVLAMVLSTLDPLMGERRDLTAEEFEQLLAFLQALTSPSAVDLSGLVPDSVPSGLPVWD